LDALTQVLEPFVSCKANPMTDAFCREGIKRAGRSLLNAYQDGGNREAREDMALASLFGGLALANAKLGAVHGIAGPLGGMYPAPHGATCAALLPHVMAVNVAAIGQRQPDSPALGRYDEVAQLLTGNLAATAEDGVQWITQLCQQLNIPSLGTYGLVQDDFADLSAKAMRASSMQGNPIQLQENELHEILARAV
jgi:alcohol dehydrogenase class IV